MTRILPSDWKLAKVSPIFKNGSKSDLNNYRPISAIPTVAKIFEKLSIVVSVGDLAGNQSQRSTY